MAPFRKGPGQGFLSQLPMVVHILRISSQPDVWVSCCSVVAMIKF